MIGLRMEQELMKTIQEKIDEFLIKEAQVKMDEKKTDDYTFYPSSAGYCIRKQWNDRKNPKLLPAGVYRKFVLGNMIHEFVQGKILTSEGYKSEDSLQWVEGKLKLRGRIDTINHEEKIIYEFKSINSLTYVIKEPKVEHVKQLNMYLHNFPDYTGIIVYLDKNDINVVEHTINYDDKLYKSTIKEFKELSKYLIDNIDPIPKKCSTPWGCDYCPKKVVKPKKPMPEWLKAKMFAKKV